MGTGVVEVTERTPLDHYLCEQGTLSAVERFSRHHEGVDSHAGFYRELLPASPPRPGQQYGFAVDLDSCTGCKACVTACHNLNGLDEGESWRSVGLLQGQTNAGPRQVTVTTACHHCVEPACLEGCPVQAYEKDPVTGVVSHLADQCFGCGYCTLTCPYEVPKLDHRRGVVRKCDLCQDRLAAGEAPACAQACPNRAITVGLVDTAAVLAGSAEGALVPGAPESRHTAPTTTYRSARPLSADLRPADDARLHPARPHPPLAVMLVLTQLSVGAFVLQALLQPFLDPTLVATLLPANAAVALGVGLLALGASVLHLGRPTLAHRAVLGVRRSWLSREIVSFTAFAVLAAAYAALVWAGGGRSPSGPVTLLSGAVALTGVAGVACSVMIYAVTGRRWWRGGATAVRFGLSPVLSGAATVLATSLVSALALGGDAPARTMAEVGVPLAWLVVATTAAKLAWEVAVLRHRRARPLTDLGRTATLLTGALRGPALCRLAAGLTGGALAPLGVAAGPSPAAGAGLAVAGLALVVAGELVERSLFFTAVAAPRMPGTRT